MLEVTCLQQRNDEVRWDKSPSDVVYVIEKDIVNLIAPGYDCILVVNSAETTGILWDYKTH